MMLCCFPLVGDTAIFETVEWSSKVRRDGNRRIVVLPEKLVLEGEDILIRQDKWGEISIHPTSPEGRKALEKFGPFADWADEKR
jgi:hypothetical protein